MRQKQISYFDFVPFFDFQYDKIIFNCQPSHFSPCSAVPEVKGKLSKKMLLNKREKKTSLG